MGTSRFLNNCIEEEVTNMWNTNGNNITMTPIHPNFTTWITTTGNCGSSCASCSCYNYSVPIYCYNCHKYFCSSCYYHHKKCHCGCCGCGTGCNKWSTWPAPTCPPYQPFNWHPVSMND